MASITVTEYAVTWDVDGLTNHVSTDRSVPESALAELSDRYSGRIVSRTVTTSSWLPVTELANRQTDAE